MNNPIVDVPIAFSARLRSEHTGAMLVHAFPPGKWDLDVLHGILEQMKPWERRKVLESIR